jgi:hypothetical protein
MLKIIFISKTLLPKEELVGGDNSYIQLSFSFPFRERKKERKKEREREKERLTD